uniref:Protein kinase domain-containing protein n=1 Tax=Plectus sambesii TaxID=2011161 RepID=A0A914W9E6_9BILA
MEYKLSYVSRNPGVSPSQQAAIATPLLTDTDSSLNFNNPSNLFTSENDEAEELPTETVPVENFMYNHSGINPEISNVTNAKYTTTVINDTVHNQRVANKNIHSNNENEIDLSDVEKIKEIGHGHFGDVYFALLKDRDGKEMPVAVKRSKISADTRTLTEEQRAEIYHQQLKSLQCEQNIMSSIGSHPNILKLIGAVTKRPEDFCVVTEYCEYGSLDKFLQGRKDEEKFVNDYIVQSADGYQLNSLEFRWKTQDDSSWGANYESRRKEGIVATSDLMWFSLQIAEAMEFLSNQSILHRDIALRNMLLASGYIVKVADFGLSRKIENDLYQPSNTFALPIAYLAPEIIRDRQFSSKSESWAFGIVLWELFTLAEHLPYVKECGGMDAWAISAFLGANKRLPIPEITPISMRWLITQLWSKNSDSRPDFVVCQSTIMEELQNANPQLADHAEKMWNPNWNPGLSLSNQRTPYEKSEISINLNEASETNKRAFRRNWISKFRTVRTLWCFLPIALGLLLFSAYFGIRSIIRTDNQVKQGTQYPVNYEEICKKLPTKAKVFFDGACYVGSNTYMQFPYAIQLCNDIPSAEISRLAWIESGDLVNALKDTLVIRDYSGKLVNESYYIGAMQISENNNIGTAPNGNWYWVDSNKNPAAPDSRGYSALNPGLKTGQKIVIENSPFNDAISSSDQNNSNDRRTLPTIVPAADCALDRDNDYIYEDRCEKSISVDGEEISDETAPLMFDNVTDALVKSPYNTENTIIHKLLLIHYITPRNQPDMGYYVPEPTDSATMEPKTTNAGASEANNKANDAIIMTTKAPAAVTSKTPPTTGPLLSVILLGLTVSLLFNEFLS